MKTKVDELMDIAWKFAHAVERNGLRSVDPDEDEMKKEFEAALKPGEPIGEVVACNDHGYPWKRVSGYEWVLAGLPIGAKVYTAPPAQTPPPPRLTGEQCKTIFAQASSAMEANINLSWRNAIAAATEDAVRKQLLGETE